MSFDINRDSVSSISSYASFTNASISRSSINSLPRASDISLIDGEELSKQLDTTQEVKGGSMLQDMFNYIKNSGKTKGETLGQKAGKAIVETLASNLEGCVKAELANKIAQTTTAFLGRAICGLGILTFVAGFVVSHLVGAAAGVMAIKAFLLLSGPASLVVGLTAGVVDAALNGPFLTDLIAAKLGLDRSKTDLLTKIGFGACGIIGFSLVFARSSIKGVAASHLFILGLTAKIVTTALMVPVLAFSSFLINFGAKIAEEGSGKSMEDIAYSKTIPEAIKNTIKLVDEKITSFCRSTYNKVVHHQKNDSKIELDPNQYTTHIHFELQQEEFS